MIYAEIRDEYNFSVSQNQEQWENATWASLSDEEWDMALKGSFLLYMFKACLQFKVLHPLHFSKAKLAKIFPDLSLVCDRCKLATIHHML